MKREILANPRRIKVHRGLISHCQTFCGSRKNRNAPLKSINIDVTVKARLREHKTSCGGADTDSSAPALHSS